MCSPSRKAQLSAELLVVAFFALAIMLSLFSIYANMRGQWAAGADARGAQAVADRLAGAINAVGQGLEGSEAEVDLRDGWWLGLEVRGWNVLASWNRSGGKATVSSPIFTDEVDFERGERVLVRKEEGRIVVGPVP